jgi:TolB protein
MRDLLTGEDRNLTNHQSDDFGPVWAPDGRQIAFASRRDGNWEVYLMDLASGDVRNLSRSREIDLAPTWSPDGHQIAFMSMRKGNFDLYVLDLKTDTLRALTTDPTDEAAPAWSPDGSQIVFVSREPTGAELRTVTVDGALSQTYGRESRGFAPAWSPDGTRLAFYARLSGRDSETIYVADLDGGQLRVIASSSNKGIDPAWWP